MATFKGQVTQSGWSVEIQTSEASSDFSTATVEKLAEVFIQAQTNLQAEGQRFVRETLGAEAFSPEKTNGQSEEAETLTDSEVPAVAS